MVSRLSRAGGILVELSHEGLAEQVGFEPTHGFCRLTVFETVPFNHLGTVPYTRREGHDSRRAGDNRTLGGLCGTPLPLEPVTGIEPAASCLEGSCSTN